MIYIRPLKRALDFVRCLCDTGGEVDSVGLVYNSVCVFAFLNVIGHHPKYSGLYFFMSMSSGTQYVIV